MNASISLLRSLSIVLGRRFSQAFRDLLPIVVVIVFFQAAVFRQPLPNYGDSLIGLIAVVVGLGLFLEGLESSLFPVGEAMADALARKGSLTWLLIFAFVLGFATTIAEPALIAITQEAAGVAADAGFIEDDRSARSKYALGMRLTVALSVGIAVALGVLRIVLGWPVHYIIIAGYLIVVLMTLIAPEEIVGIAYDSGGVTTSTVTVPLVTALGVGLASSIRRRNALTDGFGLIALASLFPIAFVLVYGALQFGLGGRLG